MERKLNCKKTIVSSISVFALAASMSVSVEAQVLDEIIVTAQKRAQSLQDVGITVTAFSEDVMKNRGLLNVDTLADVIPNLQSQDGIAGQTHFRIRGVGLNEFQASFDAPVGVNLDEFFFSKPFMIGMGFFDVSRVEVLKGPQGTVFGRNTTGGAVNYYTNKPTEEFEAGIRATYANYERVEADIHVSGPITDGLTGRVALHFVDQNDGPYFNLFNNKNIGGKDENIQLRGMLQWQGENTTILASAHVGSQKGESVPYDNLFQDIPGGAQAGGVTDPALTTIRDPEARFTLNQDYFPTRDNTARGVNLRIDHDLGWATLSSLTSYEYFERDQREDSDNTPGTTVNIDWYSKINQFTQEFRIAGEKDNWNYLFGAYYEQDDLVGVDTIDVGAVRLGDDYTQVADSYALFTNHEVALNEQISIILGARYTTEKTKLVADSYVGLGVVGTGPENQVDPTTYLANVASDVSRKDDAFNFKVGVNYNPSDDVLLFASYSTGFRSGGYDVGFNTTLIEFDPEKVKAFEVGVKSTLLDGAMTLNASAFHTTVDDYQENANLPTEFIPRRRNIGTLRTQGLEADVNWQLTERLFVSASAGYTDAEITKSDFLFGTIPIIGNTPANAPKFSSGAFASYVHPLNNRFEVEVQGGWSHVGERFLELENEADHLVSGYDTFNGRIILSPTEADWQVSVWGKNLTNEVHTVYINDVPSFGLFLAINNAPRTYGITAEVKF